MQVLRSARMFDGETVSGPVCVTVDRGRIVEVASTPAGDDVVDLGDVTLLPGLVDAHQHLILDASRDPVGALAAADDEAALATMRRAGAAALAAGVTTVRDLGDRGYLALRVRAENAADPAAGPHVLAAGPPITTRGGHCWYLGGEAEGVAGVRAAVRERAERGVDVIKVMASGGELTPGTRSHVGQYDEAELRAVVEEAHRWGLPTTAHAHATAAIDAATAAGFDALEHATFLTEDGVDDRPDVLARMAAAGVMVSVTLATRPGGTMPARFVARFGELLANFRAMRAAGIPLVLSSDAGVGPGKGHDVLPYGVAAMVELLGVPPVEALRAVTSLAARLCRVADRKGRIAVGCDADLLAVGGDPTADPAALLDVRAVYRQGQRVR